MTNTVNIHEAKTHLSRLLERVRRGETVIIAKAGAPIAQLIPYEAPERRIGALDHLGVSISDEAWEAIDDEMGEGC